MIAQRKHCRRCGRSLKPESVRYRNGSVYGPTCFKKVSAKDQYTIFDLIKAAQRKRRKSKVKRLATV